MTTARITPGTLVRLSFDTGPSSVGLVTEFAHTRADGASFVVVDWHWNDDEPGDDQPITLAASILVPLCAWVDSYADEWGMACSEPGIPTSFDVPCHYDADRVVRWVDQHGAESERFCAEHALAATVDMRREGLPFEVETFEDAS